MEGKSKRKRHSEKAKLREGMKEERYCDRDRDIDIDRDKEKEKERE
jgi:hypothetical protein